MEARELAREQLREQKRLAHNEEYATRKRMTAEEFRQSPMGRRHTAALELLRQGGVDGEILLSYVLWPTPAIEAAMEKVLAAEAA